MDFNKPSGCKKVAKFLLENLKTEAEKESLTNVLTGKTVLKADAIDLLLTILQAMTIANEVNMVEFDAAIVNENSKKEEEDKADKADKGNHQNCKVK